VQPACSSCWASFGFVAVGLLEQGWPSFNRCGCGVTRTGVAIFYKVCDYGFSRTGWPFLLCFVAMGFLEQGWPSFITFCSCGFSRTGLFIF